MSGKFCTTLLIAAVFVLAACAPTTTTPAAPTAIIPAPTTASPQPSGTPLSDQSSVALAQQTIDRLIAQDFTTAYNNFDQAMQAALPEAQLKQAWSDLIQRVGAYQSTLGTQPPAHQAQYIVVVITLQFEQAPIDLRVVVDPNTGKVSGLRFMANQTEAAKKYQPPSYADPNSFQEHEVIVGAGEWQLSGTLTVPNGPGPFPAIVLVHGSGPNDRDEAVGPDKPFKDLAWGLASRGIAVLRYDKRTKVYADKMAALQTFTVKEETIDDALSSRSTPSQTSRAASSRRPPSRTARKRAVVRRVANQRFRWS